MLLKTNAASSDAVTECRPSQGNPFSVEEYAEQLITSSPTLVCALTPDGTTLFVNPAVSRTTELQEEELLGLNWWQLLYPDREGMQVERLQHRLLRGEVVNYEMTLITKTGKKRTISWTSARRHTQGGTVRDILLIGVDVTAQKQTSLALRESQEVLQSFYDSAPLMMGLVEAIQDDILFHSCNAATAEFFRLQPSAMDHALASQLGFARMDLDAWLCFLAQSRIGSHSVSFEFSYTRTGDVRWLSTHVSHIGNTREGVPLFSYLCEDITERKRAEEALRASEKQVRHMQKMEAIGTLAGGIAHDFNNILTAILGYTEMALLRVPETHHIRPDLSEILTAGKRAKSLVQHILMFSRQDERERVPVSLHLIAEEVLGLMRASLPSTIQIVGDLRTDTSTVLAEATQMHQVVLNLCTNAEHAMRESGGTLEVRLEDVLVADEEAVHPAQHPGAYVRVTVRDSGTGMPSEVKERIFDPFFTTKPPGQGTGMGLALVHGIVTSHGGVIAVESAPGQGTTFIIDLPQFHGPVVQGAQSSGALPRGNERILFVDDEASLVQLGYEMLTALGYEVEVRTSAHEALQAIQRDPSRFDLVVTDQTMPHMTGETLSQELQRIRPHLPIVLCTGYSHMMTQEKARALGLRAYLMKPVSLNDLALSVRRILDDRAPNPRTGRRPKRPTRPTDHALHRL